MDAAFEASSKHVRSLSTDTTDTATALKLYGESPVAEMRLAARPELWYRRGRPSLRCCARVP